MQERIRGYDFSFFSDVVPSAKVALDQRSSNWTSAVKPRAAANQQQETVNQIPSPLIDDRPWTEPATATVAVELAQRLTGDGAPDGDLPCFDEVRHERERQQRWKPLAPTATQAVTLPRLFFVQRQGYSPLIFPSRSCASSVAGRAEQRRSLLPDMVLVAAMVEGSGGDGTITGEAFHRSSKLDLRPSFSFPDGFPRSNGCAADCSNGTPSLVSMRTEL
nr:hypothetical protein Iba_scaffold42489CG0010 [Ipomoea batatas]